MQAFVFGPEETLFACVQIARVDLRGKPGKNLVRPHVPFKPVVVPGFLL